MPKLILPAFKIGIFFEYLYFCLFLNFKILLKKFKTSFEDELLRVMVHGLLHFMGYDDSTDLETKQMRDKEDNNLKSFHVEH